MPDRFQPALATPQTATTEARFEAAFKEHYPRLHGYATSIVTDAAVAEDVVQQVFVRLWEKNRELSMTESVAAYLYRAVHNESLNWLKHLKVRAAHQAHTHHTQTEGTPANAGKPRELEAALHRALNALPEGCRAIFQLSRFESLKYADIAARLGISVKTVENQMGKALKVLRADLAEFLMAFLFILLTTF